MRHARIFIASSEELSEERIYIGALFGKLQRAYLAEDICLDLLEWEDFDAAYNGVRKQDEYNGKILLSDIFIGIFWKKGGEFTIEECEVASSQLSKTGKPEVFFYLKNIGENEERDESLYSYLDSLSAEGNHIIPFTDSENLGGLITKVILDKFPLRKTILLDETGDLHLENIPRRTPGKNLLRIYITGAEELKLDKNVIGDLVRKLNQANRDNSFEIDLLEPSDTELQGAVKSDMFVALFHRVADNISFEGVSRASESFQETNLPKLFIYFKDLHPGEIPESELQSFKEYICKDLGHFVNRYNSDESIKFSLLMQFMQIEGGARPEVRSTKIFVGEENVADLQNLPFAINNPEYRHLQDELLEQEELIASYRQILLMSQNDAIESLLFKAIAKREEKKKEFEEKGTLLLETASQIAGMYGQISSARLKKAIELFEKGDNRGANAILDFSEIKEEMRGNVKLLDQARAVESRASESLLNNINECKLKIRTLKNQKEPKWLQECVCIYREAINVTCGRLDGEYISLLFSFSKLLLTNRQFKESEKTLLHLLSILRDRIDGSAKAYTRLVNCLRKVAILHHQTCNFELARKEYEEILELVQKVSGGNNAVGNGTLAETYGHQAILFKDLQQYEESEAGFEKSLYYYNRYNEISGKNIDPSLARTYLNMGGLYGKQNDFIRAEEYFNKSLTLYRKLSAIYPGVYDINISTLIGNLAEIHTSNGNLELAESELDEAIEIAHKIVCQSPEAFEYKLINLMQCKAVILKKQGKLDDALLGMDDIVKQYRKLVDYSPEAYTYKLAKAVRQLADIYQLSGRNEDAIASYTEAITLYRVLSQGTPSLYKVILAKVLSRISSIYLKCKRYEEAVAGYSESKAIYQQASELKPGKYSSLMANAISKLGDIYRIQKNYQQSEIEYHESINIWRTLVEQNHGKNRLSLASDLAYAGFVAQKQERYDMAIQFYEESIIQYQILSEKQPKTYMPYLAKLFSNLGRAYLVKKNYSFAEKAFTESVRLYRNLSKTKSKQILANTGNKQSNGIEIISIGIEYAQTKTQQKYEILLASNQSLLSWVLYQNDNKQEAVNNGIKCLEIFVKYNDIQNQAKTYNMLSYIYSAFDEAKCFESIDKAIELDPQNAHYLDSKAEHLLRIGEIEKAKECCLRAISINEKFYDTSSSKVYKQLFCTEG